MGIVSDESKLTGFGTDNMGDEVTKGGILDDIKGETQRDIGGARSDEEVEMTVDKIPLRVPDARRKSSGLEPFVLPKRQYHATVAGVLS